MDDLRAERVSRALRREISDILRHELKDPRIGFVSVTEVELSSDLRQAKVYCSVLGAEDQKRKALAGLRSATGFVRAEVARRIRLRHAPELVFRLDDSIERGVRVVSLMTKLSEEEGPPVKGP